MERRRKSSPLSRVRGVDSNTKHPGGRETLLQKFRYKTVSCDNRASSLARYRVRTAVVSQNRTFSTKNDLNQSTLEIEKSNVLKIFHHRDKKEPEHSFVKFNDKRLRKLLEVIRKEARSKSKSKNIKRERVQTTQPTTELTTTKTQGSPYSKIGTPNFFKTMRKALKISRFMKSGSFEVDSDYVVTQELEEIRKAGKSMNSFFTLVVTYFYQFMQKNYNDKVVLLNYKAELIRDNQQRKFRLELARLKSMTELYGSKQAIFLRGSIISYYRSKSEFFESINKIIGRVQCLGFKQSELRIFHNYLKYITVALSTEGDLPNLHSLKLTTDSNNESISLSNLHLEKLLLSYEELIEIISSNSNRVLNKLHRLIEKESSQINQMHRIEKLLVKFLRRFRSKPKVDRIVETTTSNDFNDKIGPLIERMHEIVSDRYSTQLIDLKLAWMFSKVYIYSQNKLKAYLVLRKAFLQNIRSIEQLVYEFLILKRITPLLSRYFRSQDLYGPLKRLDNMQEWLKAIRNKDSRGKYLLLHHNKLTSIFKLKQLMEIIESLGDLAASHNEGESAIYYYEIFLYFLQVKEIYKLMMLIESNQLVRSQKLIETLEINKKMIKIKNKILEQCIAIEDYSLCLTYFALIVFIYNNSISIINNTDPNRYPKKHHLEDTELLDHQNDKKVYLRYLNFFNSRLKHTVEQYDKMFVLLEKNTSKVSNYLFLLIKNAKDDIGSLQDYTKATFENYIMQWDKKFQSKKFNYKWKIESYQRNYVGSFDFTDLENLVNIFVYKDIPKQKKNTPEEKELGKIIAKKINTEKVESFFDYRRMDNQLLSEVISYCIYLSEKDFLDKRASNNPQVIKDINLLYLKREKLETLDEHLSRVLFNMTQDQQRQFLLKLKDTRFKIRQIILHNKPQIKEYKIEDRKTLLEVHAHIRKDMIIDPDHGVGIFMRKYGRQKIKPYPPSIFYRERRNEVIEVTNKYHLQQYGESRILHYQERRKRASQDLDHYKIQFSRLDSLNISQDTKAFNEGRMIVAVAKKKSLISKFIREALIINKDFNRSVSFNSHSNKIQGEIVHLDQTMGVVNRQFFNFDLMHNTLVSNFKLKFHLKQDVISFKFIFDFKKTTQTESMFLMKLPKNLWELKESFMLDKRNPISTYFPLLHELYAEGFFRKVLNEFYSLENSITKQDLDIHEQATKSMALKYPILITKLKDYDYSVVGQLSLLNVTKKDLDAIQCLLDIMYFIGKCLICFVHRTRVGKKSLRHLDISNVDANKIHYFRRLNKIYILQIKLEKELGEFNKNSSEYINSSLLIQAPAKKDFFLKTDLFLILDCLLQKIKFFAESRQKKQSDEVRIALSRKLFKNCDGQFVFIDLVAVYSISHLEKARNRMPEIFEAVEKVYANGRLLLDKENLELMILLFSFNSFLWFEIDTDDYYHQAWRKVYMQRLQIERDENIQYLKTILLDSAKRGDSKKGTEGHRIIILADKFTKPEFSANYITFIEFIFLQSCFKHKKFGIDAIKQMSFSLIEHVKYNWKVLFNLLFKISMNPFSQKCFHRFLCGIEKYSESHHMRNDSPLQKDILFKKISIKKNNKAVVSEISLYKFDYHVLREGVTAVSSEQVRFDLLCLMGVDRSRNKLLIEFANATNSIYSIQNFFSKGVYLNRNNFDTHMGIDIEVKKGLLEREQIFVPGKDYTYKKRANTGKERSIQLNSLFDDTFNKIWLNTGKASGTNHAKGMLEGENLLNKIKTGYVVHSTLDSEAQANLRIDLTTTSEITLVKASIEGSNFYSQYLAYLEELRTLQYSFNIIDLNLSEGVIAKMNSFFSDEGIESTEMNMIRLTLYKGTESAFYIKIDLSLTKLSGQLNVARISSMNIMVYLPSKNSYSYLKVRNGAVSNKVFRILRIGSPEIRVIELKRLLVDNYISPFPHMLRSMHLIEDLYLKVDLYNSEICIIRKEGGHIQSEVWRTKTAKKMKMIELKKKNKPYKEHRKIPDSQIGFAKPRVISEDSVGSFSVFSIMDQEKLKFQLVTSGAFDEHPLNHHPSISNFSHFMRHNIPGLGLCSIKLKFYITGWQSYTQNKTNNNSSKEKLDYQNRSRFTETFASRVIELMRVFLASAGNKTVRRKSLQNRKSIRLRTGVSIQLQNRIFEQSQGKNEPIDSNSGLLSANIIASKYASKMVKSYMNIQKSTQKTTLFGADETFIVKIEVYPSKSKFVNYKAILNSVDLNNIFEVDKFADICFKKHVDLKLINLLKAVKPNVILTGFCQYLVAEARISDYFPYRKLEFSLRLNDSKIRISNSFTHADSKPSSLLKPFLEAGDSKVNNAFFRVALHNGRYIIQHVSTNSTLKRVQIRTYIPKTCRTFMSTGRFKRFETAFNRFLQRIAVLILDTSHAKLISNDFGYVSMKLRELKSKVELLKGPYSLLSQQELQSVNSLMIDNLNSANDISISGSFELTDSIESSITLSVTPRDPELSLGSVRGNFKEIIRARKPLIDLMGNRKLYEQPLKNLVIQSINECKSIGILLVEIFKILNSEIGFGSLLKKDFDAWMQEIDSPITKFGFTLPMSEINSILLACRSLKRYVEMNKRILKLAFWEQLLEDSQYYIAQDKHLLKLEGVSENLRVFDLLASRSISLSISEVVSVEVYLHEKKDPSSPMSNLSALTIPFIPLSTASASSYLIELIVISYPTQSSDYKLFQKAMNLREVINIHTAEVKSEVSNASSSSSRISFASMLALGTFLAWRVKYSNTFGLTPDDDENSDNYDWNAKGRWGDLEDNSEISN